MAIAEEVAPCTKNPAATDSWRAGERPGQLLSHDAVRAVGAEDAIGRVFAASGRDDEIASRAGTTSIDFFRDRAARRRRPRRRRARDRTPCGCTMTSAAPSAPTVNRHIGARERCRRARARAASTAADRTMTDGSERMSMASATSASARPVSPPPQGFSRGWLGSKSETGAPARARRAAAIAPAGPAPMMAMRIGVSY